MTHNKFVFNHRLVYNNNGMWGFQETMVMDETIAMNEPYFKLTV